jgi:multiple sugar transport system permease protein
MFELLKFLETFSEAKVIPRKTIPTKRVYISFAFVCSLFLALLIKQKIPLVGVFRSMFFLPNVVSLVVVGFVWKFLLTDQIGLINQLLQIIRISGNSWLGDPKFALGTILIVTIWFSMGYYMIIFLADLQEIPQEYYEAAHLDGASHWATFRYVTWPLLKPTSFFVLLVSLVSAVSGAQGFDLIFVMTQGGPANSTSLGIFYIYWHLIIPLSRPILAALAVFFFLANWNSFLWPLTITNDQSLWMVQIGIANFQMQYAGSWNYIMAASTVAALPTLLLFFVFQRQLVTSIKSSGFK